MAIQVSPGINTSEKDITTVVAGVSTTETGLVGVFRWGPVDQIVNVSDEAALVRKFGQPTNHNPETFFTGANFLSYGNALNIVRVMESGNANASLNTLSAYANSGTVSSAPAIKNDDDYLTTTIDANAMYVARYPGALGNSMKISVCDSSEAFSQDISANDVGVVSSSLSLVVGSNSATFLVQGANAANANTAANTFLGKLTVGDIVIAGNTTIGKQSLRVATIGTSTVAGSNASATITFNQPFTLSSNYSSNTITRTWEHANLFDRAPGNSKYMNDLGLTAVDELHLVVTDEDGLISGVPGTVLETWQALSRATDAKGENGSTNYYKTVLNNSSQYVRWGQDRSGAASAVSSSLATSTNTVPLYKSFVGGQDGATEAQIPIGKLALGYDRFKSKAEVDIAILMQGKARGTAADSDSVPSSNSANHSTLANYILSNIAEYRQDVIVCVSPAKADVTTNTDKAAAVAKYASNINLGTSYGVMDSGYKYQYDKYNDTFRWIPLNGDTAGCLVRTDVERDPWFSPAGQARGQIKNVVKLAWNPDKAERDTLYKAGVNPVITEKGKGTMLFGDKTLIGRISAFDRINVRRLFIVLKKSIAAASEFALFEFNDVFTRNRFVNMVEPYLRDVQGRRGITDFLVVCDETNNTPQVIDTNNFVGDIYVKPNRSINFIQLNFINTPTGVEFSEVVGQV